MGRRRSFKMKKIIPAYMKWKNKQSKNIQTSEQRKQYTRSINYNKKFSLRKIQHNIQRDKFTPLSLIKGNLSYQH